MWKEKKLDTVLYYGLPNWTQCRILVIFQGFSFFFILKIFKKSVNLETSQSLWNFAQKEKAEHHSSWCKKPVAMHLESSKYVRTWDIRNRFTKYCIYKVQHQVKQKKCKLELKKTKQNKLPKRSQKVWEIWFPWVFGWNDSYFHNLLTSCLLDNWPTLRGQEGWVLQMKNLLRCMCFMSSLLGIFCFLARNFLKGYWYHSTPPIQPPSIIVP